MYTILMSYPVQLTAGDGAVIYNEIMYITDNIGDGTYSKINKINLTNLIVTSWLNNTTINGNTTLIQGLSTIIIYNNYIYSLNISTGNIIKISLDNIQTVELWYSGLQFPVDMKEYNGHLYITNSSGVLEISFATKLITRQWANPPESSSTTGLCIYNNYLYVAMNNPGAIYKLNLLAPESTFVLFFNNFTDLNPQYIYIYLIII